jgi:hypothetical protein
MNITNWTDVSGVEQVTIDWGNEQFTTMAKSVYDAQQAASTLPSESSIPTTPQAGA